MPDMAVQTAYVLLIGGPLDGSDQRCVDLDGDGEPPVEHAFTGQQGDVLYRLACSAPDPQGRFVYLFGGH